MKRLVLIAALFAAPIAHADLAVSTGGPTGTYAVFAKNIQQVCEDKVKLNLNASSGSDQNLDRLMKKEQPAADIAFVQLDALQFAAMNDAEAGDNDLKALLVLYPEEVHVIASANLKVGGTLGFGGKPPSDITQLAGKKVGAWGGSYTTARALNAQTQLGIEVIRYKDEKEGRAALDAGQVAALIRVSGQPDGFVNGLPQGQYVLLDVPASIAAKASFYVPAKLNYRQFGVVQSIAAQSLLVTRNFRTATKRTEISALKQCIIDNLDELKEGDYHAKWKMVDPKAASARSYYEVTPTAAAAPTPVTVTGSKKK